MQSKPIAPAPEDTAANDTVMAWARRSSDGVVVHVSMLSRAQTGQACGCVCAGCGTPLQAVNAGLDAKHFERPRAHRMSFRHQPGMQRGDCAVRAARAAMVAAWMHAGVIALPERRAKVGHTGASGTPYLGTALRPPEDARIVSNKWVDAESAMLTLEDGRQVLITLRANVMLDHGVHAVLVVDTTDAEVASLSLQEVLSRAKLLVRHDCWVRHWDDARLAQEAQHTARSLAASHMDTLPVGEEFCGEPFATPEFLQTLTPGQRGETLLHLHLKQLLGRTDLLNVPAFTFPVRYSPPGGGAQLDGTATLPAMRLRLSNARLEQHLGDVVPDVLCDAQVDGDLLETWPLMLEVAVTHRVGGEKLARIQVHGLACLELDAKRLVGNSQPTVEHLKQALQAPRADSLYWVFHKHLAALEEREMERLAAEYLKQQARYAANKAYNVRINRRLDEFERLERKLQDDLRALRWRLEKTPRADLLRLYVTELAERPHDGRFWEDRRHEVYASALRKADYGSFAATELQPTLLALHAIHSAGISGTQKGIGNVLQLLQSGLTDPLLQPYMPVLLWATRQYCHTVLDHDAWDAITEVRRQVWDDIQTASLKFTRPLTNDGALAALYPELREKLWPGQPGTLGYANDLRFKRALASGPVTFPLDDMLPPTPEVVREPVPHHVVEAALGPARIRQWTRGGGTTFERWTRFPDVAKLAPWHQRTIRQAYAAREGGQSVAEFVRSQQPRSETETLHCLEVLAGVFLLA